MKKVIVSLSISLFSILYGSSFASTYTGYSNVTCGSTEYWCCTASSPYTDGPVDWYSQTNNSNGLNDTCSHYGAVGAVGCCTTTSNSTNEVYGTANGVSENGTQNIYQIYGSNGCSPPANSSYGSTQNTSGNVATNYYDDAEYCTS